MIGTKELRSDVNTAHFGHTPLEVPGSEMLELLDRLEAAEKERDALRVKVEAAERERDECNRRRLEAADHFAAQTALMKGKCDALRVKVEAMEQQEPVAWMLNCQTLGGDTGWILFWTQSGAGLCNRLQGEENEKRLYALPDAKGE